jgi:hypothetical protein
MFLYAKFIIEDFNLFEYLNISKAHQKAYIALSMKAT